jgi:hypothetical protein
MADNAAIAFLKGLLGKEPPPVNETPQVDPERPWDPTLQQETAQKAVAPPPPSGAPAPPPVQPADEAMAIAEALKRRNQEMAPWGQTGLP